LHLISKELLTMTTADAQKIYDGSARELIPKNFHFCSTQSRIEADQTCAEATASGEGGIVPGRAALGIQVEDVFTRTGGCGCDLMGLTAST
jgi:hypothetical protein